MLHQSFTPPDGETGLFLNGGDLCVDARYLLSVFHLRNADRVGLRANGGLEVLVKLSGVDAVDADEDVLILGPLVLDGVVNEKARRAPFRPAETESSRS